jgi:hypothetical protein
MFAEYMSSDLPFKASTKAPTINSEAQHKCLFVENPKSKSLEKSVIFKLGPKASVSFVVVLKAPLLNKLEFLSFLNITHVADRDTEKFLKERTEKRLGQTKGQISSCKV